MKRHVIITRKASRAIREHILKVDCNYETGGILIGYRLCKVYFIVAVTISDKADGSSKVSFFLNGVEHMRKVNDIISCFRCPPSVLGIWHSHILDGHNFSEQDKTSNRILAKELNGTLSMLVTKRHVQGVTLSISYISTTGVETSCNVIAFSKELEEIALYERK